jgi:UDP-N-acetylmuramate--alanine ligase
MNKVYFVGIKGVGMTSLACAMQDAGWQVSGSDTDEEFITDDVLAARYIEVHPLSEQVPTGSDLVICSAAYEPPETAARTASLAEALAEFVADRKIIAVAGVGGKTTTSAMLAALFQAAHRDVGYYVGTSTIAGLDAPGHNGTDPYFVVEADEYAISKSNHEAKFSLLKPDIVVTTNIVHDHPDIYPDEQATLETFKKLILSIKHGGSWIYNPDDKLTAAILSEKSLSEKIKLIPYKMNANLHLSVFGDQNVADATAAVHAAQCAGVATGEAEHAISAYKGAGRRQEFHGDVAGRLLYDDYGHHPGEVEVTVKSFKEHFAGHRIVLVFESHTYSRTESLLADFARAISLADQAFIMPIFESAREKGKVHTVTPESFAAMIPGAIPLTWENAADTIVAMSRPGDVILTMGAGFVYKLHKKLKERFKS